MEELQLLLDLQLNSLGCSERFDEDGKTNGQTDSILWPSGIRMTPLDVVSAETIGFKEEMMLEILECRGLDWLQIYSSKDLGQLVDSLSLDSLQTQ
jgi:hypothetical protein